MRAYSKIILTRKRRVKLKCINLIVRMIMFKLRMMGRKEKGKHYFKSISKNHYSVVLKWGALNDQLLIIKTILKGNIWYSSLLRIHQKT